MATGISTKFGLGAGGGIHFSDPWLMMPQIGATGGFRVHDSAGAAQNCATTAFFTEMARRGLQDQTDWTANTYKTLLSVSSGKGLVYWVNGPTAGGAETTTFEITVDGVLVEIAVGALASGERAVLHCGMGAGGLFTTANQFILPDVETLKSDKATFGASPTGMAVPVWSAVALLGVPMLKFKTSLLVRAKHSASITNSTATSYSAVMYRLGL